MEVFFVDLVKILHSGEGGDVSSGSNLETNSLVFAIDILLLFITLHSYTCVTIFVAFNIAIISSPYTFGLYSYQQGST